MRGVISTEDKFKKERSRMANLVWAEYKETNSANCRTCHKFTAEVIAKQKDFVQPIHKQALTGEATCIDCPQGVGAQGPGVAVRILAASPVFDAADCITAPKSFDNLRGEHDEMDFDRRSRFSGMPWSRSRPRRLKRLRRAMAASIVTPLTPRRSGRHSRTLPPSTRKE